MRHRDVKWFFPPDLTACLTQSLQHAASQGNWDPPQQTGRLSPESALLVRSCFPSPKPPESATAVPFSSLKGLWNDVASWGLVVSETAAWSLRLTLLMCTCAHIHATLRCMHTCVLGGFSPASGPGPWHAVYIPSPGMFFSAPLRTAYSKPPGSAHHSPALVPLLHLEGPPGYVPSYPLAAALKRHLFQEAFLSSSQGWCVSPGLHPWWGLSKLETPIHSFSFASLD